MEVRTGGTSGGAAGADRLSAVDLLTNTHRAALKMAVNGHVSATVVDNDVVAVSAGVEGTGNYLTALGGDDIRAHGSGDINTLVVTVGPGAPAELGTDALVAGGRPSPRAGNMVLFIGLSGLAGDDSVQRLTGLLHFLVDLDLLLLENGLVGGNLGEQSVGFRLLLVQLLFFGGEVQLLSFDLGALFLDLSLLSLIALLVLGQGIDNAVIVLCHELNVGHGGEIAVEIIGGEQQLKTSGEVAGDVHGAHTSLEGVVGVGDLGFGQIDLRLQIGDFSFLNGDLLVDGVDLLLEVFDKLVESIDLLLCVSLIGFKLRDLGFD